MFGKVKKTGKKVAKSLFNPTLWMGYDQLKGNGKIILSMIPKRDGTANNNKQKKKTDHSTYKAFIEKNNLTEKDVKKRITQTKWLSRLFFSGTIIMLPYTIYQFYVGHIISGITTIVLTSILFLYGVNERIVYARFMTKNTKLPVKKCFKIIRRHK